MKKASVVLALAAFVVSGAAAEDLAPPLGAARVWRIGSRLALGAEE